MLKNKGLDDQYERGWSETGKEGGYITISISISNLKTWLSLCMNWFLEDNDAKYYNSILYSVAVSSIWKKGIVLSPSFMLEFIYSQSYGHFV